MDDYKEYLATQVLNESQTVNYRMLSRALKIHGNRAKQCMYDFYAQQTKRRPDSVSATYLIIGRKKPQSQSNGVHTQQSEDTAMPSSPPFPSSSMPDATQDSQEIPSSRVVLLAKEADLDRAKAGLSDISSIHLYSLSPAAPSDLQTLGECNRRVLVDYASEDPLEKWAQYGVIQNEHVWRRTRKGQPVLPPPAPAAAPPAPKAALAPKAAASPAPKQEAPAPKDTKPAAPKSEPATKPPPATLKRDRSSIMSSFAKTQPKAAKKEATPEPALSDDEADEDTMDLTADAEPAADEKTKRDREAELRAMMDMSDTEDPEPAAKDEEGDAEMTDAPPPASQPSQAEEEAPPPPVTVDGRRRGRRRVTKKRTVKDEEGYLVTREEAAWESFSEDEAPASKPVVAVAAKPGGGASAAATAAKKSAAAGKGQSGIMSFFAKK